MEHEEIATGRGDDGWSLPSHQRSWSTRLEQAREQRGSPPLWDAVARRLDATERQRDIVAPMLRLLEQIRERVDDETWGLILDFEWRSANEIMAGVEIGLELGYDHGRASAIVATECVPGDAGNVLIGRLVDFLGTRRPSTQIYSLLSSRLSRQPSSWPAVTTRQSLEAE